MIKGTDLSGKVAFDANSLNALKLEAKENSPEALKTVAKQFESILMNMMLKSMRDATPQEGMFDNEQSRMFTSMLDQQLSSHLSQKGLGLADVLVRQLSKSGYMQPAIQNLESAVENPSSHNMPVQSRLYPDFSIPRQVPSAQPNVDSIKQTQTINQPKGVLGHVSQFLDRMLDHAKAASEATGMPAHLMLGQAALETGWGRHEIKAADGSPSYNLFGIKATGGWKGKVVETVTTEYIDGVKQKRIEKFRAYDSYADAFKDFAHLMINNPRYQHVIANVNDVAKYAQAMQKAGYATDPQYAKKLASVIQQTMRT